MRSYLNLWSKGIISIFSLLLVVYKLSWEWYSSQNEENSFANPSFNIKFLRARAVCDHTFSVRSNPSITSVTPRLLLFKESASLGVALEVADLSISEQLRKEVTFIHIIFFVILIFFLEYSNLERMSQYMGRNLFIRSLQYNKFSLNIFFIIFLWPPYFYLCNF